MSEAGEVDETEVPAAPLRGIRILRLRLRGVQKAYEVDFRVGQQVRPMSIIAGPVSTGKTTVLEFIEYLLGGSEHPSHPEVLSQVVSAMLEVELSGAVHVVERSVGRPSTSATVYTGELETVVSGRVAGARLQVSPAGAPESLSTFLLSHVGLEGIRLREAPTQDESSSDPLSIRDLMWLCFMPNERLDDKNLLFETAYMKSLKLRQVIDVVFGVHDNRAAELADRIARLETELSKLRSDLASAKRFVDEQEPRSDAHLRIEEELIQGRIASSTEALTSIEFQIREGTEFASELRDRHRSAAVEARRSAALLRDRETLLVRLAPLRAQYSEDIRKLTMLVEAHGLFDPLRVVTCPACFATLRAAPVVVDDQCSLCGTPLPEGADLHLGAVVANTLPAPSEGETSADDRDPGEDEPGSSSHLVSSHLRSTRTRLRELNDYMDGLESEADDIRRRLGTASEAEAAAAAALDRATVDAVSPFLARRDELHRVRQTHLDSLEDVQRGLRLHSGLTTREAAVGRLDANLSVLREQRKGLSDSASERRSIVSAVSKRFGEILQAFKYPKLDRPFVNDRWEPHVRDASYRDASSGARTLLSIAWCLAIFETAIERGAAHPGFLLLDSPQKNIGAGLDVEDDFSDAAVVEGVYDHIRGWLASRGAGCQVIVVDNDPPSNVRDDIVARFTRDPQRPPYGLIDDEFTTQVSPTAEET